MNLETALTLVSRGVQSVSLKKGSFRLGLLDRKFIGVLNQMVILLWRH